MLQITKWAGARMAFVGVGRLLIDPKDADFIPTAEGNKEPMKDFKQGSDTQSHLSFKTNYPGRYGKGGLDGDEIISECFKNPKRN